MKTTENRLRKQLMKKAQEERRHAARMADVKRLHRAVWLGNHPIIAFFAAWFGIRKFEWAKRYDQRYILAWARREGWRPSRLSTAVEMVDLVMRTNANRQARAMDVLRRRARAMVKWQRRKRVRG